MNNKEKRFNESSMLDKWLELERLRKLKERAIKILNQVPRYIEGYLLNLDPSLNIDVRRDFKGDPLELTIRVYLTPPRETVLHDKVEDVREALRRLEEQSVESAGAG